MTVRIYAAGVDEPAPVLVDEVLWTFPALEGAAADARRLAALLCAVAPAGVPAVVRTTPADTTAERLQNEIGDLVAHGRPGDVIGIVLCGHGLRRRDRDGDEEDGYDEVFAASDGPVADDFFRDIYGQAQEGLLVVSLVDACHSDSMAIAAQPPEEPAVMEAVLDGVSRIGISACLEAESAFEGPILPGASGGELTWALQQSWSEPASRGSYRSWFLAATALVSQRQNPRLRYLGPRPAELDLTPLSPLA